MTTMVKFFLILHTQMLLPCYNLQVFCTQSSVLHVWGQVCKNIQITALERLLDLFTTVLLQVHNSISMLMSGPFELCETWRMCWWNKSQECKSSLHLYNVFRSGLNTQTLLKHVLGSLMLWSTLDAVPLCPSPFRCRIYMFCLHTLIRKVWAAQEPLILFW